MSIPILPGINVCVIKKCFDKLKHKLNINECNRINM